MRKDSGEAVLRMWVTEPPPEDVRTALARLRRSDDVCAVAVMPDVHLANDVCVGTVTATSRKIYPQAVGGDIGCGMAAVPFDAAASALKDRQLAANLLHALGREVPILKQVRRLELPTDLAEQPLSAPQLERLKRREAAVQLGTVGRGNHFVELQSDEDGKLWLMVHSGSRSIGPLVRDYHVRFGERSRTGLWLLDAEGPQGQAYLNDMHWAIAYADANRRTIIEAVSGIIARLLGGRAIAGGTILCNHNHAAQEVIDGRPLWIHRKGAISARRGESGIIPGSMGSASYHVIGRGCEEALLSSSHGAGRALSRFEARRTISQSSLSEQVAGVWFDHRQASRMADEAPRAYKDIQKVMRAQKDLTRAVRRLTPLLSYKGT